MSKIRRSRRTSSYHHGDLERALVHAALETIRRAGVGALTLRGVGATVGVSRTALYRHFDSKAALLARVASEGFRLLYSTMTLAIDRSSSERHDTLQVMAAAYINFALANPSHYEVMFGGHLKEWERYPDLVENANRAFDQLVGAFRSVHEGSGGRGDTVECAEILWALTHGVATLALAGHLPRTAVGVEELAVRGARMLQAGMGATAW